MKAPISWIKDFVDIDIPVEELAERLTMTGLEVDGILRVGLPVTDRPAGLHGSAHCEVCISGLSWEPDKLVVGRVDEVMPHPNADRLVLCRLFDGEKEHTVLTG